MRNIRLSVPRILTGIIIINFALVIGLGIILHGDIVVLMGIFPIMLTLLFLVKHYINIPLVFMLIVCALLIDISISPIRGYGSIQASTLAGFIIFLFSTYYFLKKYNSELKPLLIVLYFTIGFSIINLPIRIFNFKGTLLSFPDTLIHLLGIVAGYFLYERKKIMHTLSLSVSVLLVLYVYFYGYDLWVNKLDYGTFSGKTYFKSPPAITLRDANNNLVQLKQGRLTVMDFWFLGCKSCFDEFPEFQKIYNNYKNNPHIQFFTVNQPFNADNNENCFAALKKMGYTFPMTAASHDLSLVKSLQISVYPTVLVMDTEGYVVYKGDLEGAEATIQSYMHPDID